MARNEISAVSYSTLLLVFLLIISNAECRTSPNALDAADATPVLTCSKVYGAQEGDTCSGIGSNFGLSDDSFLALNPNINCRTIFVGQWLCLKGGFSS
ncbi:hypothetical protein LIER_34410 [Lithospermum erythrorhizon]|uniref:LysM domain-containing protein n=1 Tax=Lithospermum erythrorhizon TaxID=34254 RepID=A0AAV3S345_LITER